MFSERICFIIEGLLNMEQLMIGHGTWPIKKAIYNLRNELSHVYDYLTWFDERDDHPPPSYQRQISSIADSSDDILTDLTRNVNSTNLVVEIWKLVDRIRKSFQQAPLHINVSQNVVGNINNSSDRQEICSTNLHLSCNTPLTIKNDIRPKSYGHVPNLDIVGFKHETETLLTHLLSNDKTHVVGIVGMGGSGKTTLAKRIYHHPNIKRHFASKVWVCISQSWDTRQILQEICRKTVGATTGNMGEEEIMERLHTFLSSQSYLIVLDDVWDVVAWNGISPALPICRGSKVLITTRIISVPNCISPTSLVLQPSPLNDGESCELFSKRMHSDHENQLNMIHNREVKLLLKRCSGLPLAINALAGVLRMDGSQSKWTRIKETWSRKMLNLKNSSTQGVVEEILALSYYDLPHYLKPCVLYLGFYPKDYKIRAEQLIQLWRAECLIRCPQENEESMAEEYLEEIANRYIIQDVTRDERGRVWRFTVHDLIQEMIVDTANKEGFHKDSLRIGPSFSGVLKTKRILHVRSFITYASFSEVKLQQLFQKFILLRVLILCRDSSFNHCLIPKEIGNLIHLRYLEVYGSYVIMLPSTFENLQNLWTLNLNGVSWRTLMPNFCEKMKDLEHIYLPNEYYVGESGEVLNLDRLQKLKTLWNAHGGEWMLSQMPKLSSALHYLKVKDIKSEEQLDAVLWTPSILKHNLQTLVLSWVDKRDIQLQDMNTLYKCESLRELILRGSIRESSKSRPIMFPPNLVKLVLFEALLTEIDVMGTIDKCCPQLKFLSLGYKAYVGNELVCSAKSFPQLVELLLYGSVELKRWSIERGAMSNLNLLYLIDCTNLQLTSQGWEFISKVPRVECEWMEESQFEKDLRLWRKDYA